MAQTTTETEDTIVQVSNVSGGWEDLGRSTRAEALATVERGTVPGLDLHGAKLRAVDWITREEIIMPTRTGAAATAKKAAEVKARSDANGDLDREARELLEEKLAGEDTPKPAPEPTKRQRQAAATKARKDAGEKAAKEREPKAATPKATKKPGIPGRVLGKQPKADTGIDWTSKAVANRIVKAKQSGKTIKAITEEMGLPAEQRSWHKVSLIWRREADRLGLDRPRNSAEVVARRIASRKAKRAS